VLTQEDVDSLRDMITEFKSRSKRGVMETGRALVESYDTFTPPDTYIIKVPERGIPKEDSDTPGNVDCDIYTVDNSGDTPTLTQIDINQKTVYNVGTADIPAGYNIAVKDRYGSFIAVSPPPATATPFTTGTSDNIVLTMLTSQIDPNTCVATTKTFHFETVTIAGLTFIALFAITDDVPGTGHP